MSDLGLLPDVPPRGPGRYAPGTRGRIKPWTAAEDLCLWPLILACESERAYLRLCVRICEVLERVPKFSDPHPSRAQIVQESVALVEVRTVTYALGDRNPALFDLVASVGNRDRGGFPLSWAEKRRVLRPWYDKPSHGETQVPPADLRRLTQRFESDAVMVDPYLTRLAQKPRPIDAECLEMVDPLTYGGAETVEAVLRLRDAAPANVPAAFEQLSNLCLLANGR